MNKKLKNIIAISLATSIISSSAVPMVFATEPAPTQVQGTKAQEPNRGLEPAAGNRPEEAGSSSHEGKRGNKFLEEADNTPPGDRTWKQQLVHGLSGSWLAHQGALGLVAGFLLSKSGEFISKIKDVRGTLSFFRYDVPYLFRDIQDWYNQKEEKERLEIKVNSENVIAKLDEEFKKVKGQERAKQQLKDIIVSILDKREQASYGNKVDKGATLIMLKGASGTGKSMLLKCLENVLMGEGNKAYCIDSSTIDSSDPKSALDQLFSPVDMSYYYGSYESNSRKQKPSLVKHLETNSNTLLKVEEYDKWGTKQTDEMFRTMHDSGEIHSRGQKIDVSNLIVVMTSNEGPQDSTGSRTSVVRDKSLMNRFTVIEFDNLSEEDYKEIAEAQLENLGSYHKARRNINIHYINVAENIAKYALKVNRGARIIEQEVISSLRTKIIKEIMKNEVAASIDPNIKPEKDLYVAYNYLNKEFVVSENEEEVKKFSDNVDKMAEEEKAKAEKEKEEKAKQEADKKLNDDTKKEPVKDQKEEKELDYNDFLDDLSGF